MHCSTLPRPVPLSRPLLRRVADAWQALLARWRQRAQERRLDREIDDAADLSERTLQDIGAPDWLREQAAVRRESQLQRMVEMRLVSMDRMPPGHRW